MSSFIKIWVLSTAPTIRGVSSSPPVSRFCPFPFTKMYSWPTLSRPTIWSIPWSWPPPFEEKVPLDDPTFTTMGLVLSSTPAIVTDFIRAPIKEFRASPISLLDG